MIELIDTHAHLDMGQFDDDRYEVIKRAYNSGVKLILNIGSTLEASKKAVELASNYAFIYAAVGVHPHDIESMGEAEYKTLEELLLKEKVVALGEIGLDYFKNYSPKEAQMKAFVRQIRLAKKCNKPVIIHSRDAKEDTLKILKQENISEIGGILHCFSGDKDMAEQAIDLGLYISFAGPITYPKAQELREVAKTVPLEKILAETDCPYLSPQKFRGKRNEPSYIRSTVEKIAEVKKVSVEEVASHIRKNVEDLFHISILPQGNDRIAYKIRNSLYLNITNRCTCHCTFCSREENPVVRGWDLRLKEEPSTEELLQEIGDPKQFEEIVFCGFGEPTLRLDVVKAVATEVKKHGGTVRINTNGHGNLINKRDILPELHGLVDAISISLNSEEETGYNNLVQPIFKEGAYEGVKDFAKKAKEHIPSVTLTVVSVPGKVDIKKCKKIAEDIGVSFRVREYNIVG